MPLVCDCSPEALPSSLRAAMVVGHPGHELKVFGWISEHRPLVHVITDGSGRHGISRLPSTAALLSRLGSVPGEVFGVATDARMYDAILSTDLSFFLNTLDGLAASLVKHQINFVAGDASEGFNPSHDLCRALLDAAVALAERANGSTILNYEFCLTEATPDYRELHDDRCMHLRLDDDLLRRKLEAADAYQEMRAEVRGALDRCGAEYFRTECLRKSAGLQVESEDCGVPFYEKWGEQRVAEGEYESVIRYGQHMLPILRALREHAAATDVNKLLGSAA